MPRLLINNAPTYYAGKKEDEKITLITKNSLRQTTTKSTVELIKWSLTVSIVVLLCMCVCVKSNVT